MKRNVNGSQRKRGATEITRSILCRRGAFRDFLLAGISLLAVAVASCLVTAPVTFAEDGLPPGVPVPAWAVGKHVHFFPAPRRQAEVLASEESQQELYELRVRAAWIHLLPR